MLSAVGARHLSQCGTCQFRLYVELTGRFPPLDGGWTYNEAIPGVHWAGGPMRMVNTR